MANTNANSIARHGVCAGTMSPMPDGIIRKPLMSMPPMAMSAESHSSQENECEADDYAVPPEHGRRGSHEIDNLATDRHQLYGTAFTRHVNSNNTQWQIYHFAPMLLVR